MALYQPLYKLDFKEPLPFFPYYEATPKGLVDVRTFIRPEEVKEISEMLWRLSGWNRNRFVELSVDWVHRNITYEMQTVEYWHTPLEVLTRRRTDCEGFAVLLQSIVEPYVENFYVGLGEADGGHAFNVWIKDGILVVDATGGWIKGLDETGFELWYIFNSREYASLSA